MLLGLRHASDPDHLAAVTTMIASAGRARPHAARLGSSGARHATSLFVFGLPVVLYSAISRGACRTRGDERRRRDRRCSRSAPARCGAGMRTSITRGDAAGRRTRSARARDGRDRGRRAAPARDDPEPRAALTALGLFAACTAVSMTLLSAGFGIALSAGAVRHSFNRVAPRARRRESCVRRLVRTRGAGVGPVHPVVCALSGHGRTARSWSSPITLDLVATRAASRTATSRSTTRPLLARGTGPRKAGARPSSSSRTAVRPSTSRPPASTSARACTSTAAGPGSGRAGRSIAPTSTTAASTASTAGRRAAADHAGAAAPHAWRYADGASSPTVA
jgi:hypothetical protein